MQRKLMAVTAILLTFMSNAKPVMALGGISINCVMSPPECRLTVSQRGRREPIQTACGQRGPAMVSWRIWVTGGAVVTLVLDCSDEDRVVVVRDGFRILAEGIVGELILLMPPQSGLIEVQVIRTGVQVRR
jgi:hypothetical protein